MPSLPKLCASRDSLACHCGQSHPRPNSVHASDVGRIWREVTGTLPRANCAGAFRAFYCSGVFDTANSSAEVLERWSAFICAYLTGDAA